MGAGKVFFANGTYRGPGYPTLVLLTDLLPGGREAGLAFAQHRFLCEARGPRVLADPLLPRAGKNATGLTRWLWSAGEWFGNRWWMFGIHGFAFLLAVSIGPRRRRIACTSLASVGALIALATAATHGGLPRYSYALLPLTYVAGWAGAVSGAVALWRGARGTPAY